MSGSSTRRIQIDLVGDAAQLERTLKSTGKSLDNLGKHTGGIKSIVKAASGLYIFNKIEEGLKEVTKAAVDNEAGLRRDGVAVKNAGENWKKLKAPIDEALKKMSVTSGFLKRDLQNAFSSAELATNNHTQALKLTNEAMQVSAQTGKPLKTVTLALGKAWQGNAVALRRLGIFTPVVTKAQDLLRAAHDKLIKSGKKLSTSQGVDYANAMRAAKASDKQASATSSLDAVHKKFAGAVADRSKTMAGQLLILDAKWDEMKVAIGEKVIPVIMAALGPLLTAMDKLGNLSGSTKTLIMAVGTAFVALAAGLKIASVAMAAFDIVMDANPIGLVVIAIAALVAGLIVLYQRVPQVRAAVQAAFGWMQQNIPPIVQKISAVIRSVWGAILPYVTTLWNSIKGMIAGALDLIKADIALFGDLIHGRWSKIWGDVKNVVSAMFSIIWAYLKGAPAIMASLLGRAGLAGLNAFLGSYYKLPGLLWSLIKAAIMGIVHNVPSLLGDLKNAGGWIASAIVNGVGALPGALVGLAESALSALKSKLESFHVSVKTKTYLGVPIPTGVSISFGGGGDGPVTPLGLAVPANGGLSPLPGGSGSKPKSFLNGNLPKGTGSDKSWTPPASSGYTFPSGGDPGAGAAAAAKGADKAAAAFAKVQKHLQDLANTAAAAAAGPLAKLAGAFDKVAGTVLKAFDAKTQAHLKELSDAADKAGKKIADDLAANLKGITDAQAVLTPSEQALKDLQAGHDQAGRDADAAKGAADLAAANTGLNADGTAMSVADQAAAQAAAQKEIDDAAYNQRVYDLGVAATNERTAKDAQAVIDAQAATDAATAKQALVTAQLAKDQLDYQASREIAQGALNDKLTDLKASLAKHPKAWKKTHDAIIQQLTDGVGDYAAVGTLIGNGYIDALKKSLGLTGADAGAAVGPVGKADAASGKAAAHAKKKHAWGGIFDHASIIGDTVGEAGPEAIVPLSNPARAAQVMQQAGLGGVTQNIYFAPNTPISTGLAVAGYRARMALG